MDEARALLGEVGDEGEREFVNYGLTCLHRVAGDASDELDAVALVKFLRQMYSRKSLLEAVLRLDRAAYRWDD